MKAVRQFLSDRLLSGLFAAMVAYTLVFQALLAGAAQGAMAAAALDPLGVICMDHSVGRADQHDKDDKTAPECPCGTLCRLASGAAATLADGSVPALELPSSGFTLLRPVVQTLVLVFQRDPGVSARAPPLSI